MRAEFGADPDGEPQIARIQDQLAAHRRDTEYRDADPLAFADALDGVVSREIALGADGARAVDLAEQAAHQCATAAEEPASELRSAPR